MVPSDRVQMTRDELLERAARLRTQAELLTSYLNGETQSHPDALR